MKIIFLSCFLLIIFILVFIGVFRFFSEKQVDDIHPYIYCETQIIEKSKTLMIIPIYNNISVAENASWCNYILSLNKTLGMHGVYHTYEEFYSTQSIEYVKLGREEFKKCFGFYPVLFEAPQLAFNEENKKTLINSGFSEFRGNIYSIFHKVYHCSDSGIYSNSFIDLF